MTKQLLDAYRFDIELRMRDEGRPPLAALVRPHEITAAGEVFKDDRVRVTAALNDHPPIEHSFAYRFDTVDRSIVISGDTRYSENVIKLARGADVLVHEVVSRRVLGAARRTAAAGRRTAHPRQPHRRARRRPRRRRRRRGDGRALTLCADGRARRPFGPAVDRRRPTAFQGQGGRRQRSAGAVVRSNRQPFERRARLC